MARPTLNTLSLCSGAGGLELGIDLALDYLGIRSRVVGYCEREAYAASVLLARMEDQTVDPAPIFCGDLAECDWREWRGAVDLVSAGFPCQPFSAAGKQLGKADERWIWDDVARCIRDVGPRRFVYLENVPGLAIHGLDAVLGSLAELGFNAEWDVFSAAGVGAPHLRRRLFVLAWRVSDAERNGVRDQPERGQGAAPAPYGRDSEPLDVGAEDVADALWVFGGKRTRRERVFDQRAEDVADGEDDHRRSGERHQEAGTGPDGQRRRRPSGSSESLADSDGGGLEGERKQERSGIESPRGDEPDRSGDHGGLAWEGVGNAWGKRLQGLESTGPTPGTTGRAGIPPFPPGPADADTWRAVLERWPELAPAVANTRDGSAGAVGDSSGERSLDGCRKTPEPGRNWKDDRVSAPPGEYRNREAQPELRGLANGLAPRHERLRTAGNGVVPLVAARAFVTLARRAGIA